MLNIGTKAPEFALKDQNNEIHHLSDYQGQKVLLYFYPKDNTSGCTLQAKGYSEMIHEYLKRGIKVIGISKDSIKSHKNFETKQELKITLLSDDSLDAINAYDVYKEKTLYGKKYMGVVRTTYLIDENGYIIYANDKVKAKEDAYKMLEQL
ncbi:MAG: peroxiredoxin [Firmicutes bacterium]|nr:peroxiredoxin [Bacillota bacterium]MDY3091707.1 peroxiredoxin [Erysipelotrichaceae bacterium]